MTTYLKKPARRPGRRVACPGDRRRPRHAGLPVAALVAACVACTALPGPAAAIQTLDAADHAELEAAVSATGVTRVALADDRIRRVIRSPGGFDVEHDAATGDLYLRPVEAPGPAADEMSGAPLPVTLFLGTERGFTYRLTLTPDARPSAQVLIRNASAAGKSTARAPAGAARQPRVAELVRLVRAAARRERLPGYVVEAPAPDRSKWPPAIESWRGERFTAHVLPAGWATDAAAVAERFGAGVAAVWIASPETSAARDRIAVVVTEPDRAGTVR